MPATKYDLDYLSNMDDYPKAALAQAAGKKVRWLTAQINKPADADVVAACKQVEHLWIWSWCDLDLQRLGHLTPTVVRLVRGRQTSLQGLNDKRLRALWLDGPSRLKALDALTVPYIELVGCNQLDLNTLGNVRGLACLSMGSMKTIPTLNFVDHCSTLEGLIFAGYSFSAQDLSPLTRSRSLRLIYSNRLNDDQVAWVAAGNRRVFVCNERVAFDRGTPVSSFDGGEFEDRWERLLKRHKVRLDA